MPASWTKACWRTVSKAATLIENSALLADQVMDDFLNSNDVITNGVDVVHPVKTNLKGVPVRTSVSSKVIDQFKQEGKVLRGYEASYGRPSFCKINSFLLNTLHWLGGSESRSIKRFYGSLRYGGGRVDSLAYLEAFNRGSEYFKRVAFNIRNKTMATLLGLTAGCCTVLSLDEVKYTKKVNLAANPGPTYSSVGFTSKLDSFEMSFLVANEYLAELRSGRTPPSPLFSISGRAKLLTKQNFLRKMFEQKPVGRAVWMADAHESLLCSMFTIPLLSYFKRTLKVVLLGFNKFTSDVKNIAGRYSKFDTFINLDISKLDSSVRRVLTHYAFNLVRVPFKGCFEKEPIYSELLDRIEDWFINTQLVLPGGGIVTKLGGHPSGSDFISIINTLVVATAIVSSLKAVHSGTLGISYEVGVYGDNTLIGFYTRSKDPAIRRERGESLMFRLCSYMTKVFGLKTNPLESKVAVHFYVQVGVPLLPPGSEIKDFSSDLLRQLHAQKSRKLGRSLRPDERVRIVGTEPRGPAGGRTHRWTYVFAESVSFLSYYFKENYTMIRPTFEVIERLFHPERRPSTIEEHKMLLFSALVENYNNQHTVNHIMHYWYDALHMEKQGIVQAHQADKHNRLCFLTPPIPHDRRQLPYDRGLDGTRAWYRRQRKIVCIESSHCMIDFFQSWNEVLSSCKKVYREHSDMWWRIRKELRMESKTRRGLSNYKFFSENGSVLEVQKTSNYNAILYGSKRFVDASEGKMLLLSREKQTKIIQSIMNGDNVNTIINHKTPSFLRLR